MIESESILKSVPAEKAFYFFNGIGNYTGKSANSLKEFVDKVKEVDPKSLEFHLRRRDFENWTSGVLKDEELTRQVKELRETGLPNEKLRDRLHSIASQRVSQLTRSPMQQISSHENQTGWKRDYPRRRQ
jgi:hypothetical protein